MQLRAVPRLVPRLPRQAPRQFSLAATLGRDKSVIYNSSNRPEPSLAPGWDSTSHRTARRTAVLAPGPEHSKAVLRALAGRPAVEARLAEYHASAVKLSSWLHHRRLPPEPGEQRPGPAWAPVDWDDTAALTWLVGRAAGEVAVLHSLLSAVAAARPGWQPRTLFDFGSGLCSGLWAARGVFGQMTEAFLVDTSKDMNDLARLILGGGDSMDLPAGITFRLQLPRAVTLQYDLVVCSATLMELPSAAARLASLHALWERVGEDGVLVLAEPGTNAGFRAISEARHYLSQLGGELVGHAAAPCPHDKPCPRYTTDSIPCNFPTRHRNFSLPGLNQGKDKDKVDTTLTSYLVWARGEREAGGLPRLVEAPVRAGTCHYCRLCTAQGGLQEVLVRKNSQPELFQVTKRLQWGEQLPVLLDWPQNKVKVGTPWMKRKRQLAELEGSLAEG